MAESLPQFATLATRNYIVDDGGQILAVTSQQSLFPKENLLSPLRSKRLRTTTASVAQKIDVSLVTPVVFPGICALVDSNLDDNETVSIEGATETTFNTGHADYAKWNFTTYQQDWTPKTRTGRRVLRWYPGSADVAGANVFALRPFWRLTLPANGTIDSDGDGVADTYYELGVWFLGAYQRLPINVGFDRGLSDPSVNAESDGGAIYPDRRPTFHELSSDAPLLDDASSISMLRALDDAGETRHCIQDLWGWATAENKKADSCYYGHVTKVKQARFVQMYDRLSHVFVEARA